MDDLYLQAQIAALALQNARLRNQVRRLAADNIGLYLRLGEIEKRLALIEGRPSAPAIQKEPKPVADAYIARIALGLTE